MNTNESRLAASLNSYLYDRVWGQPEGHYRKNVIPSSIGKKAHKCVVNSSIGEGIRLPDATSLWYVYELPIEFYAEFSATPVTDWITLEQYIQTYRLDVRLHTDCGRWLHRNRIQVTKANRGKTLVIAIERSMFKDLNIPYAQHTDVFAAMYLNKVTEPLVISNHIMTADNYTAMLNKWNLSSYVIKEGYLADKTNTFPYVVGEAIEFIIDPNYHGTFTIDLANDDACRNFISTIDNEHKIIAHIPKELNPNNHIITHHTCDFFLRPRNTEDKLTKGIFFHRANEPANFTQLTHNDFAFDHRFLDEMRGALKSFEVELVVIVRDIDRIGPMVPDMNHILTLYKHHTDAEILNLLESHENDGLEFWAAVNLETSELIRHMSTGLHVRGQLSLERAINALGIYNVLALHSKFTWTTVTHRVQHIWTLNTPPLLKGSVGGLVSKNGVVIPPSLVTISIPFAGSVTVAIDENFVIEVGDVITFVAFADGNDTNNTFTPTLGNESISIDTTTYEVYDIQTVTPVDVFGETLSIGRRLSNPDTYTVTPGTVTFNVLDNMHTVSETTALFHRYINIDSTLGVNAPTVIPIVNGDGAPILGSLTGIVTLNNSVLIRDLDYRIVTIESDGYELKQFLILSNHEYVRATGNQLGIWLTRGNDKTTFGFTSGSGMDYTPSDTIDLGIAELSTYGGLLLQGKDLSLLPEIEVGRPYSIIENIGSAGAIFLSDYDTSKSDAIRAELHDKLSPDEVTLQYPTDGKYKVTSLFLNTVIRDILSGALSLGYEPDAVRMMDNLAAYEHLKQYDVLYTGTMDMDYIQVVTYDNLYLPTHESVQVLDWLIEVVTTEIIKVNTPVAEDPEV